LIFRAKTAGVPPGFHKNSPSGQVVPAENETPIVAPRAALQPDQVTGQADGFNFPPK